MEIKESDNDNLQSQQNDLNLYTKLNSDKNIKKVTSIVPFKKNISLFDLSLAGRGPKEDRIFGQNEFYRKNIRRGLSFLKKDGEGHMLSRKGLEKFFDLRYEYIEIGKGNMSTEWLNNRKEDRNLRNVIFNDIEKALINGSSIEIYKTLKANGENAQISYMKKYDAWIISSKNVSIM